MSLSSKSKSGLHGAHHRKVLMISLLIVLAISSATIVYTFTMGSDSASFCDAIHVANEEELRIAVNDAENDKPVAIVFDNDISLTDSSLIIPADKNIKLTSSGETSFFKLIGATDLGLHATMFGYETINVESGGMLELAGIIVTHVNDVNAFGTGVYVQYGGTCIMTGGEISGNKITGNGAGVCNWGGTFELRGGVISNNVAWSGGGGVLNGGSFVMSGGKISNNTAEDGGGVYLNGGSFSMSGGEISGNTAIMGGAVYNRNNGAFNRSGGEISDNITESGDVIYTKK